ncbi:MAG: outer membrane beta-barrel protein [Niabella sp.]
MVAPDIIPQGKIGQCFSLELGLKKSIQKGKGEWFFNANDLLNTMVIKRTIQGNGFYYTSDDYYETQVIRVGYSYKL